MKWTTSIWMDWDITTVMVVNTHGSIAMRLDSIWRELGRHRLVVSAQSWDTALGWEIEMLWFLASVFSCLRYSPDVYIMAGSPMLPGLFHTCLTSWLYILNFNHYILIQLLWNFSKCLHCSTIFSWDSNSFINPSKRWSIYGDCKPF